MTTGKLYEKVAIKLSDPAIMKLGKALAAKEAEYKSVDEEKAEALNTFNAKLKTIEAEIADITNQINSGQEEKDIEIREEPDYARKMVMKVRVEDGQPIGHRPMTLNEIAEGRKDELEADADDEGAEASSDGEAEEKPRRGRRRRAESTEAVEEATAEE